MRTTMNKKHYIKPLTESTLLAADEGLLASSEIEIDDETTTTVQFSRNELLLLFWIDSE